MKTAPYEPPPAKKLPKPEPILIDVNADCQSIVVNAPAAEVYRQLLRIEDLPKIITSIKKIELLNLNRFHCKSVINGEEIESDVTIMMRVPERRVAWQAVSDQFRIGVVFLDPLLGGVTKVTVKVRSILEPVMLSGALRHYLRNLKQFIEQSHSQH
jgi:uncharacterized membrane protein